MSFVVAENLLKQMGQEWTTAEIKDVAAFDCASYLYNLILNATHHFGGRRLWRNWIALLVIPP